MSDSYRTLTKTWMFCPGFLISAFFLGVTEGWFIDILKFLEFFILGKFLKISRFLTTNIHNQLRSQLKIAEWIIELQQMSNRQHKAARFKTLTVLAFDWFVQSKREQLCLMKSVGDLSRTLKIPKRDDIEQQILRQFVNKF